MNPAGPLVSIVIPAYNCAKYVEETYISITKQTWEDWEIIFVNDGSTDNTLEILNKLAQDKRVRVISQSNGKQGKARNNGIKHANGDWIAFLDADDIWTPNKLELQLARTIEMNADLSFTDGYICLFNDMSLREHRFGVENKIYQGNDGVQLFHEKNRVPTSTVLSKKSILVSIGAFPEDKDIQNCEDYFLWTKLLAEGYKLLGIGEALLLYRVYPESSTGSEIKLLYPLINCLIRIPGQHLEARKTHLTSTLKKLLEVSESNEAYNIAKPLIEKAVVALFNGFRKPILLAGLKTSKRIFRSMLWRLG